MMADDCSLNEATCFLTRPEIATTGACPFVVDGPLDAALDLSSAVTEVTNTRHRCYVVALTLSLLPNHFHLRIAGAVPARNKMLPGLNPFDPAGYEILMVPPLLRLAEARLSDGTLVRPLSTNKGRIYLTLSGILIAGDVIDRYIIHRHLEDLGLAGPTAPVLSWSSRVLPPIADRGVLHFWALADLPAELLGISYFTISRAFDSAPTLTLQQLGRVATEAHMPRSYNGLVR